MNDIIITKVLYNFFYLNSKKIKYSYIYTLKYIE